MLDLAQYDTTFDSLEDIYTIPTLDPIDYFWPNKVLPAPEKPKMPFNREAFSNLSPSDQVLFEQFGQGDIVDVKHDCIHHAFEEYAATMPQMIAADHLGDTITYKNLNAQANRLANMLAEHGVTTGDAVAVFLRRSVPMLVSILASLKVGAAYVPQDAKVAPETQLRHVANAVEAKVILTTSEYRHLIPVDEANGQICIEVDRIMKQPLPKQSFDFIPDEQITRDNRCFILFTSGTTGNPNGVQVTHGNVCNILLTQPGDLGMRPGIKVGQFLSISFDMAAWETLGALSHGATLMIRGRDFQAIAEQVDVIIATPSVLGTIDADRCHQVKTVAVAGEPCPRPLADKWSQFCTFYNSCGPTETTIVNTAQQYHALRDKLTIGAPMPNNTVYVLDKDMKPCAIGEIGEMWAGGTCVSAGYLKNPELTSERYAPDPFVGEGNVMFRTRDLGRWTDDGELEHFGRTDDQVKVRGFRVELDSVSGALESEATCEQAVTLKYDSRDLVAFIRPATANVEAAKQKVADTLPYYCTPSHIVAMDNFPLTSRGKIDKRTLLKMATDQIES